MKKGEGITIKSCQTWTAVQTLPEGEGLEEGKREDKREINGDEGDLILDVEHTLHYIQMMYSRIVN